MSDEATSGPPVSVTFTSLGGELLPAQIEAFAITEAADGGDSVRIRFTMAFEAFQHALADEAFNLFPQVLLGTGVEGFEAGTPVEIEAELRPVAARGFARNQAGPPTELGDNELLLRAESWLALSVMQRLELPEEIGDDAHAAIGCRTSWSQPAPANAMPTTIAGVASTTLRELGYQVDALDQNLFRTLVITSGRSWVMLVQANEEERTCICWSVYSQMAAPEQRPAVAEYLMEANYELSVGSFEMDPGDGEIRFRTSIDVGDASLDGGLFARLVAKNVDGMSRALPMLAAYFG